MGTGELASPLRPWPGPSGASHPAAAQRRELRRGRARTARTEPLEMGAQTNSKESDPRPTLRDHSHSRVARDPRSGCLVSRRQPQGFSWSQPGTCSSVWGRSPAAPAAGERAVDATGKGEGSPLAAVCFKESRRAVKTRQGLVHRYITTPQHPAARPTSTNRSRVLRRPAMPSVQLS